MAEDLHFTLAIDTCVGAGSSSLWRGAEIVDKREGDSAKGIDVLTSISELLDVAGIVVRDIEKVELTRGPGSYTGVRTGIALVLGLRQAIDLEVRSCTVFEAIAMAAPDEAMRFLTIVRAGREEAAIQEFGRNDRGTAKPLSDRHTIIGFDQLSEMIETGTCGPLVGDAGLLESIGDLADTAGLPAQNYHKTDLNISAYVHSHISRRSGSGSRGETLEAIYTREFIFGR